MRRCWRGNGLCGLSRSWGRWLYKSSRLLLRRSRTRGKWLAWEIPLVTLMTKTYRYTIRKMRADLYSLVWFLTSDISRLQCLWRPPLRQQLESDEALLLLPHRRVLLYLQTPIGKRPCDRGRNSRGSNGDKHDRWNIGNSFEQQKRLSRAIGCHRLIALTGYFVDNQAHPTEELDAGEAGLYAMTVHACWSRGPNIRCQ